MSSKANRRTAFDFKANNEHGIPDGMTIDADGNLWVAVFDGERYGSRTTLIFFGPVNLPCLQTGHQNRSPNPQEA